MVERGENRRSEGIQISEIRLSEEWWKGEKRVKKGAAVMSQIWGLGKRKFGRDWGKKLWLFDALVWSVLGFGVEVWGWKEWDNMERMQERYIK